MRCNACSSAGPYRISIEAGIVAGAGLPEDPEEVFFGEGLTVPLTAEVELVVRDHGSAGDLAAEGEREAALSTLFGGGCPFDVTANPDDHGGAFFAAVAGSFGSDPGP